jgi:diadenylate cyclase
MSVNPFERIEQLAARISTYPWWQVLIELTIIWFIVYLAVRFIQGTRAAAALKGMFLLLLVGTLTIRIVGTHESFQRLAFLYDNLLAIFAIALVVIFQPELRRALTRIGEAPLFRRSYQPQTVTVDAVTEAASFLSKAKFGGLIVLERQTPLKSLIEGATILNAQVSAELLKTIFFPSTALHDLAVVIRGETITAAGVQLPLAEPQDMPDPTLGSRHRAAVGLTQETDAVVVVVSEETGTISLAERGRLTRGLSPEELRGLLVLKLNPGLVTTITKAPIAGPAPDRPPGDAAGTDGPSPGDSLAGGTALALDPLSDSGAQTSPVESSPRHSPSAAPRAGH